ncbi:hypothetical protein EXIGLDRAFT_449024 [Exidia glandulosa HHB12029]|uniref:Uncharacterized protein n=1 Tax=Exidia glandulosa HHB12029 TaxID=1314781 RepID=A0A165AYL2_EXIGL|nr:hypothetical protein EXIGLDRAFT_464625 [Exidia glandulosa HHB12029]KZV79810.1 hypothetical protein EXIGLDRAFT_449024 [Exidia glandulosa HHB12029]
MSPSSYRHSRYHVCTMTRPYSPPPQRTDVNGHAVVGRGHQSTCSRVPDLSTPSHSEDRR